MEGLVVVVSSTAARLQTNPPAPHPLRTPLVRYACGFFPQSGAPNEHGASHGTYHTLNMPFRDGLSDAVFVPLFRDVLGRAVDAYQPDVIVLQAGADGLSADPMASFNLTSRGIAAAVRATAALKRPLLLLGGGGYDPTSTARAWTAATAAAIGPYVEAQLPEDIPDHAHFGDYGPDFKLHTTANPTPDKNDEAYAAKLVKHARSVLGNLKRQRRLGGSSTNGQKSATGKAKASKKAKCAAT